MLRHLKHLTNDHMIGTPYVQVYYVNKRKTNGYYSILPLLELLRKGVFKNVIKAPTDTVRRICSAF